MIIRNWGASQSYYVLLPAISLRLLTSVTTHSDHGSESTSLSYTHLEFAAGRFNATVPTYLSGHALFATMSYDIQIGLATPSEEADIRSRRHRPPYSLESFLEWEEEAAGRGATQWVMYKDMESQTTPESKSHSIGRTVMGSFQTIPRRALVASRGADGQVQVDKVSCSLIQSMFVFEEFRRQGLAAKALRLIKDQLESYAEADHGNIKFLYLYSYVGPVRNLPFLSPLFVLQAHPLIWLRSCTRKEAGRPFLPRMPRSPLSSRALKRPQHLEMWSFLM
jgi:GNAT superfamily N-acetyltransferase